MHNSISFCYIICKWLYWLVKLHTPHKMLCPSYINFCLKSHYAPLSIMFNLLHSSTNQQLLENDLCNQISHYKKYGGAVYPSYINYYLKIEASIILLCQQCSTPYTAVWIKTYVKSTLICNQDSHYEKYRWFQLYKGHQIDTFHCQQRSLDHKGGNW